jgi:citrate synthase
MTLIIDTTTKPIPEMVAEESAACPAFVTRICLEQPCEDNPYNASQRLIHGYDLAELWRNLGFVDALLLLLTGELPQPPQRLLLERLLIGLMNPGPRHPAVRAAMLAGVSKTAPEHLLSLGLLTGSGEQGGALEVIASHSYLEKHIMSDATDCARACLAVELAPGFGIRHGGPEPVWQQLGQDLVSAWPESPVMEWCGTFAATLAEGNRGWLAPGLVAAVGLALGLGARESMGLYQLSIAPGVMIQGMEQTHRPISSNPVLPDASYHLVE